MEYLSHSVEETEALGEALGKTLKPGAVVPTSAASAWGSPPLPGALPGALAAPSG